MFTKPQMHKTLFRSIIFFFTMLLPLSVPAEQLINISTNGYIDSTGMAAGFIISDESTRNSSGVRRIAIFGEKYNSNVDARLVLTDLSGNQVYDSNDDWEKHPTACELEMALRAPHNTTDAAFAITLGSGIYIARLTSVNGIYGPGIVSITDITNSNATGSCGGGPVDNSCTSNSHCDFDDYCKVPAPGHTGMCELKPTFCNNNYDPVCGFDNKTYTNECKAAEAGVNVSSSGECHVDNSCTSNSHCDSLAYCKQPSPGHTGMCEFKPSFCNNNYDPVCGFDNKTYTNECKAAEAGVNVSSSSECHVDNSCTSNSHCDSLAYCKQPSPGHTGICEFKPSFCNNNYDPVCGFDNKTYTNECKAAEAGVNVSSSGECHVDNSCTNNSHCDSLAYCKQFSPGATGMCELKPSFCNNNYDPVCGFDNQTYTNPCKAAEAGVNVLWFGACDV